MDTLKPKNLFLIDGLGALLSIFLLGFVLVKLEPYFGIPVSTLYILAGLPVFFALYDLYCYLKEPENTSAFLKGIAILNLSYCVLSIGFAIHHSNVIKNLGWVYIILEVLILIVLATIQLRIANRMD